MPHTLGEDAVESVARLTDGRGMDRKRLGIQFLWSLLLALLVYMALILYGTGGSCPARLADFPWKWLPPRWG